MSILGSWTVDETDERALAELGNVSLEFRQAGELVYTIRTDSKKQIILMEYRVDGSEIVTDQPSAPQVERTAYSVSPDGILTLEFGGVPYRFREFRGKSPITDGE